MALSYSCYAGYTLSWREPETTREWECRWKYSPQLGYSRVVLGARGLPLALTFLMGCNVRVKRSCVSPGCRLMSRTTIKYTLGHTHVFIFDSFFFNSHSQIFSGVWKEASTCINTFGKVCNFQKKKKSNSPTHVPYSCSCMYAFTLLSLLMNWELTAGV